MSFEIVSQSGQQRPTAATLRVTDHAESVTGTRLAP